MLRRLSIFAIIISLFVLAGCGGGDPVQEAKGQIEKFVKACKDGDKETVKSCFTKEALADIGKDIELDKAIDYIIGVGKTMKAEEMTGSVSEDGKTVTFKMKKASDEKDGSKGKDEMKMVKEDGVWKIAKSK